MYTHVSTARPSTVHGRTETQRVTIGIHDAGTDRAVAPPHPLDRRCRCPAGERQAAVHGAARSVARARACMVARVHGRAHGGRHLWSCMVARVHGGRARACTGTHDSRVPRTSGETAVATLTGIGKSSQRAPRVARANESAAHHCKGAQSTRGRRSALQMYVARGRCGVNVV